MTSIKIESGEFCILLQCEYKEIISAIYNDFHHFISQKKPDFIITLKIYSLLDIPTNRFGKINYSLNTCEIPIEQYDKEQFLLIMRSLFSIICSKNNAMLLHSASIAINNRGYIFSGPSNAGKSTLSLLSSAYTFLSDDYIIVKKKGYKFIVFGTPFGGEFIKLRKVLKPNNQSAIIDKIFFIKKALQHKIEIKRPTSALHDLLNEVFFYRDDSKECQRLIENSFTLLYNMCNTVPCYTLYFQKNAGFWQKINKL